MGALAQEERARSVAPASALTPAHRSGWRAPRDLSGRSLRCPDMCIKLSVAAQSAAGGEAVLGGANPEAGRTRARRQRGAGVAPPLVCCVGAFAASIGGSRRRRL